MKLTSRPRRGAGVRNAAAAPWTTPGITNPNRQTVIRATGAPSTTQSGQRIYELRCDACQTRYGSNGKDIHFRLCPQCQQGAPSEPLTQPLTLPLFA